MGVLCCTYGAALVYLCGTKTGVQERTEFSYLKDFQSVFVFFSMSSTLLLHKKAGTP